MSTISPRRERISRRDFLRTSAALLGAGTLGWSEWDRVYASASTFNIGLYTDSHYADRDPAGSRHYRDSSVKLSEFVRAMNEIQPAFVIVLGDFVDKGETLAAEWSYLQHIEKIYRGFHGPCHHVIGNHDVATFTKKQFRTGAGMPSSHYSFDSGPVHCIVLDANYNADFSPYRAGNFTWTETYIPPSEQKWLEADLRNTTKPTLVFIHQPLDDEAGPHGVKNAPEVRRLLEASGQVKAVFQGHNHGGAYRRIHGIPYFTLHAMVEGPGVANNAYSLAQVAPDGAVAIQGFGHQPHRPGEAGPE